MNDSVGTALKHLADKLDRPVEKLWEGLIAYAPFYAAKGIIVASILVLMMAACAAMLYWAFRERKKGKEDMDGWIFGSATFAVFWAFILFMATVQDGAMVLAALFSPEAWATIKVLGLIR